MISHSCLIFSHFPFQDSLDSDKAEEGHEQSSTSCTPVLPFACSTSPKKKKMRTEVVQCEKTKSIQSLQKEEDENIILAWSYAIKLSTMTTLQRLLADKLTDK